MKFQKQLHKQKYHHNWKTLNGFEDDLLPKEGPNDPDFPPETEPLEVEVETDKLQEAPDDFIPEGFTVDEFGGKHPPSTEDLLKQFRDTAYEQNPATHEESVL